MGQHGEIGGTEVVLRAVYDGSEENKQYFKYTPNGEIKVGILNENAASMFEHGKSISSILLRLNKDERNSCRSCSLSPK